MPCLFDLLCLSSPFEWMGAAGFRLEGVGGWVTVVFQIPH